MKKDTLKRRLSIALALVAFILGAFLSLIFAIIIVLASGPLLVYVINDNNPISWRLITLAFCCIVSLVFSLFLTFIGYINIKNLDLLI